MGVDGGFISLRNDNTLMFAPNLVRTDSYNANE